MIDKLILGTVQIGIDYGINNKRGKISSDESFKILHEAYRCGIRFLDTAEGYGCAMSVIGNYHLTSQNTFKIINKFNHDDINQNLKLIRGFEITHVNNYYGYLFHDFNDFLNNDLVNDLKEQKAIGNINKIGVSVYSNEQFIKAISNSEIDIIQLPFNLLDNSSKRLELMKKAKLLNKELHVRSIFLQGLFFKEISELSIYFTPLIPYLLKLKEISTKYEISIYEMAIQYALSFEEIDFVLLGVDNLDHLKMNLSIAGNQINEDLKKEINAIDVKEIELLNPSNWN